MAVVVDEYGDDGGHRHARGPARGDRRRDRGRVRPPGHVGRADRRTRIRIDGRTRSTTSTRSSRPSSSRRTSTRWPASSSGARSGRPRSATTCRADGLRLRVVEVEGSRILKIEVEFGVATRHRPTSRAAAPGFAGWNRAIGASAPRLHALLVGVVSEALALQMAIVAIGWQVYSVHESPLELGLVGLVEFLPLLLLALPAGISPTHDRDDDLLAVMGVLDRVVSVWPPRRDRCRRSSGRSTRSRSPGGRQRDRRAGGTCAHAVARAAGDPRQRARPALDRIQGSAVVGPALGGILFAIQRRTRLRRRDRALDRRARVRARDAQRPCARHPRAPSVSTRSWRAFASSGARTCFSARSRSTSSRCSSAAPWRSFRSSRRTSSGSAHRARLPPCCSRGRLAAVRARIARYPIQRQRRADALGGRRGVRRLHGRLRPLQDDVAVDARAGAGGRVRHGERRPALDDPPARDARRAARTRDCGGDGLHQRVERARGVRVRRRGRAHRCGAGGRLGGVATIVVAAAWWKLFPRSPASTGSTSCGRSASRRVEQPARRRRCGSTRRRARSDGEPAAGLPRAAARRRPGRGSPGSRSRNVCAPVARTCAALRSPSSRAASAWTTL